MKKIIYLIRHGETTLNVNKILQGGGVDSELNQKGIIQSEKFYQTYKDVPFKKIYTSELRRSIQSVSLFIKNGIPHESLSSLNELKYGIHDGKMESEGPASLYPTLVNRWNTGHLEDRLEKGESPAEVEIRLRDAWTTIMSRSEEDLILISMHGRAMRILLAIISNQSIMNMQNFHHSNLGLYLISMDNDKCTLLKSNDITHLEKGLASEVEGHIA